MHSRFRSISQRTAPLVLLLLLPWAISLHAQANPYFTAISDPMPKDMMMFMLLPDYQHARATNNFITGMGMVEYGVTNRLTVGFMIEGQAISGLAPAYGGIRVHTYMRLFRRDHLLNFTVYGEYEGLNAAALYKMEVSGFGNGDLSGPLPIVRRTQARTFEERAILYHDWGRTNFTFNFINETGLSGPGNNMGYAFGIFRQPTHSGMAMALGKEMDGKDMAGMTNVSAPPALSIKRFGYGVEMIGALGDSHQFGFDWHNQQQYVGPVFSYSLSRNWDVRVETLVGLSGVSDPFVLRTGLSYSIDHFAKRLAHLF